MHTRLNRYRNFGFLIVLFTFLSGVFAEASFYTQMYGQPSTSQKSGNGEYFSFPVYSGSYAQQNQRNSQNVNQNQNQFGSSTSATELLDRFSSQNIQSGFVSNRNLQDLTEFGQQSQNGGNFDGGSSSYSVGDGTQLTSYHELEGNFRGKRNDFRIKEWIYGGEQLKYNRNFGTQNNYATNLGFNQRSLADNINTGASYANTQTTKNTASKNTAQQTSTNRYSLQQTNFGSGFSIVFNQ
ncbi:MAG: hypothetical protein AABW64_02210 [Nanoarchaeota archaeon]